MAYDAQEYVKVSGPDFRGRVRLHWQEMEIEVRINWGVIKTMQDAWGSEAFLEQVALALDASDMVALMHLTSMCVWNVETDERITLEEAESWVFPINHIREAIRQSWMYSWHGGEPIVEKEDAEGDEKKSMMMTVASWLWPFNRRSKLVSQSRNSGD